MHAFFDDPPELPRAAIASRDPVELDRVWLETADPGQQRDALLVWWHERYEDPAESTPYNGAEGGYLFINGGPYDPGNVLFDEFEGDVPKEVIQQVVDDLYHNVGDEWAPVQRYEEDLDDSYDVEPHERNEPVFQLAISVNEVDRLVALAHDQAGASDILHRHAFIALIAALENYLWTTTKYWVTKDSEVLRKLVENWPLLKDQPMKMGQIFDRYGKLQEIVGEALKHMLWHRLGDVKSLMKHGLGIELPPVGDLEAKVKIRHHLVHRNGVDLNAQPVYLRRDDVERLKRQLLEFCLAIEEALIEKWPDEAAGLALQGIRGRITTMGEVGSVEPAPYEEPF